MQCLVGIIVRSIKVTDCPTSAKALYGGVTSIVGEGGYFLY